MSSGAKLYEEAAKKAQAEDNQDKKDDKDGDVKDAEYEEK